MKIETLLASNAGGFLSGGSHRAGLILLQKKKTWRSKHYESYYDEKWALICYTGCKSCDAPQQTELQTRHSSTYLQNSGFFLGLLGQHISKYNPAETKKE